MEPISFTVSKTWDLPAGAFAFRKSSIECWKESMLPLPTKPPLQLQLQPKPLKRYKKIMVPVQAHQPPSNSSQDLTPLTRRTFLLVSIKNIGETVKHLFCFL